MKRDTYKNMVYGALLLLIVTFIGFYYGFMINEHISPKCELPHLLNCYKTENLGKNIFLHLCLKNNKYEIDLRKYNNMKPSCQGVTLDLFQMINLNKYFKFNHEISGPTQNTSNN